MNLFRWKSEYSRNYPSGDIIVMAPTVEDARVLALAGFATHVNRWNYYDLNNEYDRELVQEKRQIFEEDIAKMPEQVESGVLIIEGSD